MDSAQPFGQSPEDIDKLLSHNSKFKMILDINHIRANNPSMKLVDDFYNKFGDKIMEYHLSGLNSEKPHIPLYQSLQLDIIEAVRDLSKPIICEALLTPETLIKEKEYVEKNINK